METRLGIVPLPPGHYRIVGYTDCRYRRKVELDVRAGELTLVTTSGGLFIHRDLPDYDLAVEVAKAEVVGWRHELDTARE